jgi:hypothetical protein
MSSLNEMVCNVECLSSSHWNKALTDKMETLAIRVTPTACPLEQLGVMGCTRCMNKNEVIRDSAGSGRGNWLSSTLVKLRDDQ